MAVGWVKLYRELLDKAIWTCSTPEQKAVLIAVLLMVYGDENEWQWRGDKFKTSPGQRITSLESIAKTAGVSIQNVRTALKKFEKLGFLTDESTKTGRLITIANWGIYQSKEVEPNKGTNKDLTKRSQRPNKDLTPTKKDKKYKNDEKDKKERYGECVTLAREEHQKLVEQLGEVKAADYIQKLDEYKASTGKQYKSDYHTILTWVRRDEEKAPKTVSPIRQNSNKPHSNLDSSREAARILFGDDCNGQQADYPQNGHHGFPQQQSKVIGGGYSRQGDSTISRIPVSTG